MDDTNIMMMMMMRVEKPEEHPPPPPPPPTIQIKSWLCDGTILQSVWHYFTKCLPIKQKDPDPKSPWEGISHDLLELLFLKPLEPIEYANILRVCKSWGEVKPPPCFPQAMLYDNSYTFTVGDDYYYDIDVCLKRYCIGSSHGWLIIRMFNSKKLDMEFYFLFNIFTRSNMQLPWLDRTTENPAIFFSSAPTDPDCTLLMLDPSFPGFLFCNKRSNKWIEAQCEYPLYSQPPCRNYLWTAIALGGKFYALSSQGNLVAIEINYHVAPSLPNAAEATTITVLPVTNINKPIAMSIIPDDWFLVESLGELLMVTFYRRKKDWSLTDLDFLRLDFETMTWIEMKSPPGDQVLFIGRDCSFSIGASEIWGEYSNNNIKGSSSTGEEEERRGGGNYIYIADDYAEKTCRYDMHSHEMMVSTVFPGNYYSDLGEYKNECTKMLWVRPPTTFVQ